MQINYDISNQCFVFLFNKKILAIIYFYFEFIRINTLVKKFLFIDLSFISLHCYQYYCEGFITLAFTSQINIQVCRKEGTIDFAVILIIPGIVLFYVP